MSATSLPATSKSPLDRFLSLFADVRHGESGRLLLLFLNVFLILTAYYVMKPVREALILAQPGGAEIKSYSMALTGGVAGVRCPGLWCAGRAAAAPPT